MKSAPFHSYFIAVGKLEKTHEVALKTSYGYEKLVSFHLLVSTLFHSTNFIAELPQAPSAPVGGASIAIGIGKSIKPRKFGSCPHPSIRPSVHTYVRTHGLGLGTSLSLSLIWSPSYSKSNTKTFFGLLRVNVNVIETCKNTLLLQHFCSHVFS